MVKGKSKTENCIQILEDLYGVTKAERIDPMDLLVATILSQNTTDKNSLKAFGRLKASYIDYESMISAPEERIEEIIKVGGLAKQKAHRIKVTLKKIRADAGSLDLGFLKDMLMKDAKDYLLTLPGVGPKTASVVLLFAFHKNTMPVDTHVFRLSKRIGLVSENANIDETQRELEILIPKGKYMSFHINLIRHGRLICKARNPIHSKCELRDICDCYIQATRLK
jgi:endonuclease-3